MKIDLTALEIRYLVDLLYLGSRMLTDPDPGSPLFDGYKNVQGKLFSLCRDNKMNALVSEHSDNPSPEYLDGGILDVIQRYADHCTFHNLGCMLARRELETLGRDSQDNGNYAIELIVMAERYKKHFKACGVEHLFLDGILPGLNEECPPFLIDYDDEDDPI